MKKIITLVLALVMVFAVAASASALVPENALTVVNGSDRFDLKVELTGGPVVAGTTITIPSVVANKAYVQNEVLFYAITLVAKKGFKPETQIGTAAMTIAGTGVNVAGYPQLKSYWYSLDDAKWLEITTLTFAPNAVYNTLTLDATQLNYLEAATSAITNLKYDTTRVFSGYGLVTSSTTAPAITVKVATPVMVTYDGTNADTIAKTTYKTAAGYKIRKLDTRVWSVEDATENYVTFKANAAGKCTYIGFCAKGGTTEQITKGDYYNAATGAYEYDVWMNLAGTKLSAANAAAIDAIFTFMGFDYALVNTNAILDADFLKKTTETNLVATATGNIFADKVTTDTVTVVPEVSAPVIEVPKTGSAATFAGIALIVLAAAAAFVSKKVRA